MKLSTTAVTLGLALAPTMVLAQNFQLIATNTPPFNQPNPADWRPVLRYDIAGAGGAVTTFANLPTTEVFDPAGVAVHTAGLFVYVTTAGSQINRFRLDEDGGITELPAISVPGAQILHFTCVSPSARELYIADLGANRVSRFTILGNSDLILKPSIPSASAIDASVSPDGTELFVGNHFQGGITRFRLNPTNDTWAQTGTIDAPQMGSFAIYNAPFCLADIDDGSGTGARDGGVTIDDLLYFLALFADGDVHADIDDGSGTAQPDGGVTIDDLLYFLQRYAAGC